MMCGNSLKFESHPVSYLHRDMGQTTALLIMKCSIQAYLRLCNTDGSIMFTRRRLKIHAGSDLLIAKYMLHSPNSTQVCFNCSIQCGWANTAFKCAFSFDLTPIQIPIIISSDLLNMIMN